MESLGTNTAMRDISREVELLMVIQPQTYYTVRISVLSTRHVMLFSTEMMGMGSVSCTLIMIYKIKVILPTALIPLISKAQVFKEYDMIDLYR